jgi:hypothetical protein
MSSCYRDNPLMKPSHFEEDESTKYHLQEDEGSTQKQRFQTLSSIAPTNNRSSGSIPYTSRPHLVGVCGCNSTHIFHLLTCSTLLLHLSTSCLTSNLIINLALQLKVSKGNKHNCTHLFCNYLLVTTVCTRCAPAETWHLSWQLDFYIHTMLQSLPEQCIPHLPEHMTLCIDTMMNVGVLTFRQALHTVVFRTVESTLSIKCTLFSPWICPKSSMWHLPCSPV